MMMSLKRFSDLNEANVCWDEGAQRSDVSLALKCEEAEKTENGQFLAAFRQCTLQRYATTDFLGKRLEKLISCRAIFVGTKRT